MFGSRKSRDPLDRPPLPRWLAWVLFGFIGYIIVIGNIDRHRTPDAVPTEPARTAQKEEARDYPAIRRALDVTNWQRAFNPLLDKGLTVRDFTTGKGRPAACGDEVTVLLRGRTSDGDNFDAEHDETKPMRFIVGKGKPFKAAEQAVVGMRVGGERNADAPSVLVYGKDKAARELSTLQLRLNLSKLEPELPENGAPLMVSFGETKNEGARCGDSIAVKLRIWDEADETPSNLAFKELKLGARQLAIGLDYVLPGIAPGETRTVFLPAAYQLHDGNESPFDGKTMRVVEVTRE